MQWENPHLVVDISDTMDLKLKALACHVSQIGHRFEAVEQRVRERARELGAPKGYAYAETFDHVVMHADEPRAPQRDRAKSPGRPRGAGLPGRDPRAGPVHPQRGRGRRGPGVPGRPDRQVARLSGCPSERIVLVIASGANRVDEAKVAALVGEPITKADAAFVRARTGFAIGGVPARRTRDSPETLIDEDLLQWDEIWAAAGTPNSIFRLTPGRAGGHDAGSGRTDRVRAVGLALECSECLACHSEGSLAWPTPSRAPPRTLTEMMRRRAALTPDQQYFELYGETVTYRTPLGAERSLRRRPRARRSRRR